MGRKCLNVYQLARCDQKRFKPEHFQIYKGGANAFERAEEVETAVSGAAYAMIWFYSSSAAQTEVSVAILF